MLTKWILDQLKITIWMEHFRNKLNRWRLVRVFFSEYQYQVKCTIFEWCISRPVRTVKWFWLNRTKCNVPKIVPENNSIPTHNISIFWCSTDTRWWVILNPDGKQFRKYLKKTNYQENMQKKAFTVWSHASNAVWQVLSW